MGFIIESIGLNDDNHIHISMITFGDCIYFMHVFQEVSVEQFIIKVFAFYRRIRNDKVTICITYNSVYKTKCITFRMSYIG